MRLILVLACLMVFIVPSLVVIGIKRYQALEVEQAGESHPEWTKRGEVLFFNASWCGPCRQMKPIVSDLRHKGFHFRDVDVDKNQTLAAKYGVRAVPTFVFVQNGSEVRRFSGGTSADNLRKLCSDPAYH